MKSRKRQRLDELISARMNQLQEVQSIQRTGKEALETILGLETETITSDKEAIPQKIILYLKDGLKGVERNYTKYPNTFHEVIRDNLNEESEGILYMFLWRLSWGYGRNYCRIGYSDIVKNTLIKSRNTARRAMSGLINKRFIIKALTEEEGLNITQEGTLYRVITPEEILNNTIEEGYVLLDISIEGVTMLSIPKMDTVQNGHTGVSNSGIPNLGIPNEKSVIAMINDKCGQNGHTQNGHGLKDNNKDSFKNTLSTDEIISSFYKGLGHSRISREKRERAEECIEELTVDNFSLEDIQFAIEWTLKNNTEKLYDFSIIKHTIGEAMTAKEKADAIEKQRLDEGNKSLLEREEYERLEKEKQKYEAYKETMSPDDRTKLRERALAEIRNDEQIKEDFISDMLIGIKENEILKKELGKL